MAMTAAACGCDESESGFAEENVAAPYPLWREK
jgi:hypothetical protein